jgi:hypothetical protein
MRRPMQIPSFTPARLALLALALGATFALAACGGDEASDDLGPDPATVAPVDSPIYVEAVVRPEGDQKDDLHEALRKLLNTDDPGAMIRDLVEESAQEEGVSYSEDIEPWLGQRLGLFVTSFSGEDGEGAAAVAVTDQDAAQDAVDKAIEGDAEDAEYEGVAYKVDDDDAAVGFVEDFLVAGTEDGFKSAVDAANGEALADSDAAEEALDSALDDSLFRVYVDAPAVVDLAVESGEVSRRDIRSFESQLEALGDGLLVVSGAATADTMAIEASGPAEGDSEEPTAIVSELPSGAWLAFGTSNVGERIAAGYQNLIEGVQSSLGDLGDDLPGGEIPDIQEELGDQLGIDVTEDLGWAGDLGGFVQGASVFNLGGGIVIETDDEDAAERTLDDLARALGRDPSIRVNETEDGFELQAQGAPLGAQAALRDGKVVFAFGGATAEDVLSPSETLGDSDSFSSAGDALGDGLEPGLFIDFPEIVALVDSTGQSDPSLEQAKPTLNALSYLVAGGGTEDDRSIARLVLGVQEAGSSEGDAAGFIP